MVREYKYLTPEEAQHFVEHGWVKIENAVAPEYLKWIDNMWVRLGWDKNDKSTWTIPYLKMPRHREVRCEEFCPEAWKKMCEIVGGEDKIDPVRERYYGDQLICNFGSEELIGQTHDPRTAKGWHTDNDWYRQFLDSSGNALTVIFCMTDVLPQGGGTIVCEDGIRKLCRTFYDHPEGLDPPFVGIYDHIKDCSKFAEVVAKAGDVIVTHGMLPHAGGPNHLHYPRVITNPHVNMHEPFNLNRPDGDYTLCEQVILRALDRSSIPEYKPTRPRLSFYPRTAWFKREKVEPELERMIAHAIANGGSAEDVDSVYLKGDEAIAQHERNNGYDKPIGPTGVSLEGNEKGFVPTTNKHLVGFQTPVSSRAQSPQVAAH